MAYLYLRDESNYFRFNKCTLYFNLSLPQPMGDLPIALNSRELYMHHIKIVFMNGIYRPLQNTLCILILF